MKFSIRDLLFVTVIAALAMGWWADARRRTHEATEEVKKHKEEMKTLQDENFGLIGTLALAREIQEINKSTIEKMQRQLQVQPKP